MNTSPIHCFTWVGSEAPFLDDPHVEHCGDVMVGRYGGNSTAGATGNEDGALVWTDPNGTWEFAVLLDAHASAESAILVLTAIENMKPTLVDAMSHQVEHALSTIEDQLAALFRSDSFREQCQTVQGETACLIVARKEQFLWWLNVGDCMLFLFHPDLDAFGQRMLNQRNFFEWIGRVNSFDLPVPCYSSGTRELRTGRNLILMATDGLLHAVNPEDTSFHLDRDGNLAQSVQSQLQLVHSKAGADSATVIAWNYDNDETTAHPST